MVDDTLNKLLQIRDCLTSFPRMSEYENDGKFWYEVNLWTAKVWVAVESIEGLIKAAKSSEIPEDAEMEETELPRRKLLEMCNSAQGIALERGDKLFKANQRVHDLEQELRQKQESIDPYVWLDDPRTKIMLAGWGAIQTNLQNEAVQAKIRGWNVVLIPEAVKAQQLWEGLTAKPEIEVQEGK